MEGVFLKKYIDSHDLSKIYNITLSTIYYRVRMNQFPKPCKTIGRKQFWDVDDICKFIDEEGSKKKEVLLQLKGCDLDAF